jgi:hypothetical protein
MAPCKFLGARVCYYEGERGLPRAGFGMSMDRAPVDLSRHEGMGREWGSGGGYGESTKGLRVPNLFLEPGLPSTLSLSSWT